MNGYFGTNNESYNGKIKFKNLTNLKSRQMPDNVFIEFGRFRPENVNLEQGMILILDKKENEGLNVVFENRVIHTGKTLSIDEQFGIEIAETTQLNDIIYDETDYISKQEKVASALITAEDQAKKIMSYNIDGVYIASDVVRYYPYGSYLSHVLGIVGVDNQGLTGLEFAYGIPGSVGGAIMMNAGAYGGEIKDVIF